MTVVVRAVTTKGDADSRPFGAIEGKGLFTSEVEHEVAAGRADAAVHSAKDLTAALAPGLAIVGVPRRAAVHDVVVGGAGATGEERIAALPPGALVGTSSMRRRALVREQREDLELAELRGNLDTRLAKVASGAVAVAVLAAAGPERLGQSAGDGEGPLAGAAHGAGGGVDAAPLDAGRWIPAPGQGALAIEARGERTDVAALLAPLQDPGARAELECERAYAERLEGGCSVPLGCLARAGDTTITATGYLGHPGYSLGLRKRASGPLGEARAVGIELAESVLEAGGDQILAALHDGELVEVEEP